MQRQKSKWLGAIIAVVVVGALAIAANGNSQRATSGALLADPAAAPAPTQTVTVLSAGDALGLIAKVGIVAALLGGSLWLLRRYGGSATRAAGRTGVVHLADTILLPNGRAIHVLDLGDRAVVVGATAQQFTPLAEFDDPAALARLRAAPARPEEQWRGLGQRVGALVQQFTAPTKATAGAAQPAPYDGWGDYEEAPTMTLAPAPAADSAAAAAPAVFRRIHPAPNPVPLLERLGQGMPRAAASEAPVDPKIRSISDRLRDGRRAG